ncbi:MAG: hypothetical protein IPG94_10205 [Kineosporiaceae bacterium]|nr:hypothetical protein [Kineosporiaceae bacterium]
MNPANPANTATVRPPYADVVDLDRYPIHDLGSPPGRTLLARCRAELEADGVCSLPGFVRDDAVAEMIELAQELADVAWASQSRHTVYFDPPDATVPDDDPRARLVRSAKHGLAYDQLPAEAPIRRLYENDDLTHFIAAVLGKDIFYRSADPLDAVQVTTSGLAGVPASGGINSRGDLRRRAALDDDPSRRVRLASSPGALAIFRGHHALHRVTPVAGSRPRINSVLTYGEVPDMRLNDLTSMIFYGRTSPR